MLLAFSRLGKGLPGLLGSAKWQRALTTSGGSLEPAAPKAVPMSKLKDSFNDGTSINYLEELEERYNRDPNSVDRSWASFFKNMGESQHGCRNGLTFVPILLLASACGTSLRQCQNLCLHWPF